MCPMCERDVEYLLHVFFDCEYATHCWRTLELDLDMSLVDYAPSWLLQRLASDSTEVKEKIAMVLWGVWTARNFKVWEGKNMTPQVAMECSKKLFSEWQEVRKRTLSRINTSSKDCRVETSRWKAPVLGTLKVNVDASVYTGAGFSSVGMILRDHLGGFMQAKNVRRAG